MSAQLTDHQTELAELIINLLNLEDISISEFSPDLRLFDSGLGLDSIDALEIAVAIAQKYGVHLKAEDEKTREVFTTLRSLSEYISANSAPVSGVAAVQP